MRPQLPFMAGGEPDMRWRRDIYTGVSGLCVLRLSLMQHAGRLKLKSKAARSLYLSPKGISQNPDISLSALGAALTLLIHIQVRAKEEDTVIIL
jgi:hypothetical protein